MAAHSRGVKRPYGDLDVSQVPSDAEFAKMTEEQLCKWAAYFFEKGEDHWILYANNPHRIVSCWYPAHAASLHVHPPVTR